MLEAWITTWQAQSLVVSFAIAYLIQVVMYFGAATELTLVYGALRHYFKIGALIDTQPLQHQQLRHEITRSLGACLIYAATTLLYLKYSASFSSADNIWPSSWSQGLIQIVGFLLLNDFCAYWTHRLLHTRQLATFHSPHHDFVRVTPWSALSLHPIEALLNQLPYLLFIGVLFIFQLPIGIGTLLLLQLILMIGAANSHSNFDPAGGRFAKLNEWKLLKNQTFFHQRHHRYGRDNYGYMGPHWDHVFGTNYK
jgi:sterol desaturase/sphingolipid hydroxylase (fatty acid hydroxylase superfamily)